MVTTQILKDIELREKVMNGHVYTLEGWFRDANDDSNEQFEEDIKILFCEADKVRNLYTNARSQINDGKDPTETMNEASSLVRKFEGLMNKIAAVHKA